MVALQIRQMFPALQRVNGVEAADSFRGFVGLLAILRWSVKPETDDQIAPTIIT
jgi:hypothetical protein